MFFRFSVFQFHYFKKQDFSEVQEEMVKSKFHYGRLHH
jgi:hypothetical protein